MEQICYRIAIATFDSEVTWLGGEDTLSPVDGIVFNKTLSKLIFGLIIFTNNLVLMIQIIVFESMYP